MTKKIIALSAIAAFATTTFASTDVETRLSKMEKQIKKLEKKLKKSNKKLNMVKAHDAADNIKWNIDFRTSVDKIEYKFADGLTKATNDSLLTNRLWMNMAYAPTSNISFRGRLSYLKAYGAESNNNQRSGSADNGRFDWVSNEAAQGDNSLNVKQAYWLYMNDTFLGTDVSWTASVGRRPATDGLLANFREDQKRQSALAHTVNVEFDGASFRWNLDKVTPLEGSWLKLCMGRGITNAKARFNGRDADYSNDTALHGDSNMIGFIFVPYDDGQYSVHTNWATATHLIGKNQMAGGNADFKDFGGMSWTTAAFVADGIGEDISDRLNDTKFFISFAQSKSNPNSGQAGSYMLGSATEKTGTSTWIGMTTPCPIYPDATIGIEWNKGSEYWRSMTYAEDTMIGSKIAARGTAVEVYYNKPISKVLTASIRYTKIDYDYSGSNGFFGSDSAPTKITDQAMYVSEASDVRAYIRYRF